MNESMKLLQDIEAAAYTSGLSSFGNDTDDWLTEFQSAGKEITSSVWEQIIFIISHDILRKESLLGLS